VQPTGDRVGLVVELAARVQDGHDDLERRPLLRRVLADGDAPPVVDDPDAAVGQDRDVDLVAAPRHGLVDGVVDDLPDQVVQPPQPVEPMYMPGRLRTASRPSRTVMSDAP
jgi:hypothetical protein